MNEPARAWSARRFLETHNALRGFAALAVFLYHVQMEPNYRLPLGWAAPIVARGYVWVDFFFILSGFVLSLTYAERLGAGTVREVRSFLAARIARVVPMHLFALGLLLGLVLVFRPGPHTPGAAPYWAFLADPGYLRLTLQAALVQIWSYGAALSWNIPSWSISAEMHVYLLLPVMALALRRMPRAAPVLLLALSAAIYLLILVARPGLDILDPLAILRCLAGFALGVGIERVFSKSAALSERTATLLQALAVAGIVILMLSPAHDVWIVAPFALLVFASARDRGILARALAGRPAQRLGEISYSVYLLNFPLLLAGGLAWPFASRAIQGLPDLAQRLVWVAVLLAAIIAASRLTFRWVEGPSRDRLRGLFGAGKESSKATFPLSEPALWTNSRASREILAWQTNRARSLQAAVVLSAASRATAGCSPARACSPTSRPRCSIRCCPSTSPRR